MKNLTGNSIQKPISGYSICVKGIVVEFLYSKRFRQPKIGVNKGLIIVDCKSSLDDFEKVFNIFCVGHIKRNTEVLFEMPIQDFEELTSNPNFNAEKLEI